jgi:signal transduction histidine kinase
LRASVVDGNDLPAAIKALAEELASDHYGNQVVFRVSLQGTSRPLSPLARDEIYQIVAEALRNARRHAQASAIEIELRYDERELRVRLRDNGKGIDPTFLSEDGVRGYYGLAGMRERAKLLGGQLSIWTAAASGTEIELTVPAAQVYTMTPARRLGWVRRIISGEIEELAHE